MEHDHPESDDSFDDTYRENTEMFGHPYQELQDYFSSNPVKGTLLDLGCGQGRDSLFLASLGYDVTAVDISQVGVDQMMDAAEKKGLKIKGIAGDVLSLELEQRFDVILFDMILHSFDKPQQQELLRKYAGYLKENGVMVIVFPDDMEAGYFESVLNSIGYKWNLLEEITINDVPKIEGEEADFTFEMIVFQPIPCD
ncbi:2-polyprenyl-3-methyl-5-hydroxy-6-metoxy-1,4-benzoquinol methylase [Methanohalophilus levihalophilus]|uniref:class I SAM-dependent methyltransferase n=1 Tax=Methanohalophilus levihalophilus TaxID=1431282 RepID=UPI001AE1CC9F|nr:class I SAM-dependent methyltransferase [Methanohalophilus levihalophilus]MBP2030746.1 2-polyprenyl-3-methyl-5-hydroxy-6-metoxy-1,4-benzoquinol methylase [Methanohalophilus levihalophilus]